MEALANINNHKETFMTGLRDSFQFVALEPLASSKYNVLKRLREAVLEVNKIKAGIKQAQPLNEFINEL